MPSGPTGVLFDNAQLRLWARRRTGASPCPARPERPSGGTGRRGRSRPGFGRALRCPAPDLAVDIVLEASDRIEDVLPDDRRISHDASSSDNDVDTTYLGIAFIFSPKSPASDLMGGHALANPSYVIATQQLRICSLQLIGLDRVALVTAIELERPAAVGEVRPAPLALSSTRILNDAVEGDELADHQPAHERVPFSQANPFAGSACTRP